MQVHAVESYEDVEEVFDVEKVREKLRRRKTALQARQKRLERRIRREAEVLLFEAAVRESGGPLAPTELEKRVARLRSRVPLSKEAA